MLNRVCVFARTGGDGSMAALWLEPSGTQKIVHLGSGSGSTLVCVLTIPATASEIVRHPETMSTESPLDPFNKWVKENVA